MKKINLLKWGFLCLFCMLTTMVGATKYECWFPNSSTITGGSTTADEEFFTFTRGSSSSNTKDYGSATYNYTTYYYAFKIEGSPCQITFTTTEEMVLTMVFSDSINTDGDFLYDADIYIQEENDENATVLKAETGTTIIKDTIPAGSYTLTKDDKAYLFYISVESTNITEANWDWQNHNPASIDYIGGEDTNYTIQNTAEWIDSDASGVQMYVDATSGKLHANNGTAQFNAGTILRVPVKNVGDEVTVSGYKDDDGNTLYSICGNEVNVGDTDPYTYTATQDDVDNGFVQIESLEGTRGYLYYVKVAYQTAFTADQIDYDAIESAESPDYSSGEEGETGDITVTLKTDVSAFTTSITSDDKIEFEVANLPDGAGLYCKTYDNGEAGDPSWLQVDEDGVYYWYSFFGMTLESGHTYTWSVYVYSSSNSTNEDDLLASFENIVTIEGSDDGSSKVQLTGINPDPSTTETLETNEITLTFSDNVTITNAYVFSYEDGNKTNVDVTPTDTEASETWTITVPEETMETLTGLADQGVGFSMVVYAQDENGNDVYDMDGELTFIEVAYDAVSYTSESGNGEGSETALELTFDPASGSTITGSLSEIKVTYEYDADELGEDVEVYLNPGLNASVKVTDESGNAVTDDEGNEITADLSTGDEGNECVITLSSALTEGTYQIILDGPEGENGAAFSVEIDGDETSYAGTTLTYTITESEETGNEIELTFDPASGSTITGSLSEIKVTYEYDADELGEDVEVYLNPGLNASVKVTDESGNAVTDDEGNEITADLSTGDEGNECVITLSSALTEGTYQIILDGPEGENGAAFSVEIDGDETSYAGTTLTYTITASDDENGEGEGNEGDEGDESSSTITVSDANYCTFASSNIATSTGDITFTLTSDNDSEVTSTSHGSVTISQDGTETELTCCVKLNSHPSITFTTTEEMVMTLVFETDDNLSDEEHTDRCITIDGESSTITEGNVIQVTLEAGDHTLARVSGTEHYLYYIGLTSTTESGINGVTLRATSDDRFYNLNGQRVTTPRNGIYILNGKKVLIK
ncbi:MAG: hypothetical protein LUD48_01720 [Prevotella sp.]|nr:hypothetical protein [Prevotella sp.]